MVTVDLRTLFETLGPPGAKSPDGVAVSAVPIPGFRTHRIAKDGQGSAALLISTGGAPPSGYPVQLENLSVEHGVRCRIWHGDKVVEEGIFTVIRCPARDALVLHYFLKVSLPLLGVLGDHPTDQQVRISSMGSLSCFRLCPSRHETLFRGCALSSF